MHLSKTFLKDIRHRINTETRTRIQVRVGDPGEVETRKIPKKIGCGTEHFTMNGEVCRIWGGGNSWDALDSEKIDLKTVSFCCTLCQEDAKSRQYLLADMLDDRGVSFIKAVKQHNRGETHYMHEIFFRGCAPHPTMP